jgi:hypothetical protein
MNYVYDIINFMSLYIKMEDKDSNPFNLFPPVFYCRVEIYRKGRHHRTLRKSFLFQNKQIEKDDELVCIMSNDKTNFDDDNLTIMTPSQVNMLVQNNWYGVHPDITKAGLLYHDTLNAIGCNRLR